MYTKKEKTTIEKLKPENARATKKVSRFWVDQAKRTGTLECKKLRYL